MMSRPIRQSGGARPGPTAILRVVDSALQVYDRLRNLGTATICPSRALFVPPLQITEAGSFPAGADTNWLR